MMHLSLVTSHYRHAAQPCVHQAAPVAPRPSLSAREAQLVSRSSHLPSPVGPPPLAPPAYSALAFLRQLLLLRRLIFSRERNQAPPSAKGPVPHYHRLMVKDFRFLCQKVSVIVRAFPDRRRMNPSYRLFRSFHYLERKAQGRGLV